MTENEELKKAALQLKAMVMCTSINGSYSCSDCINGQNCRNDEYNTDKDFEKSAIIIFDALEELESYRAIGTIDEFKALKEDNRFLEFLYNHIPPNEMEQYLSMYQMKAKVAVNGYADQSGLMPAT